MTAILCVTRNARDAVRLMLQSLRRHTPEPFELLVADNGSTDGTLSDLRRVAGIQVFSLAERRRLDAVAASARAEAAVRLSARLYALANELEPADRAALAGIRRAAPPPVPTPQANDHGLALDWLAARVRTPCFVTVDSDVEFLAAGWLGALLATMDEGSLAAVGEFEPGTTRSRPRLAPCLLCVRTSVFRDDRLTFRGRVEVHDAKEASRWKRRSPTIRIGLDELADLPSAVLYDTAAGLFEGLVAADRRWSATPASVRAAYRHYGHMSWACNRRERGDDDPSIRRHYDASISGIRDRLATTYGGP